MVEIRAITEDPKDLVWDLIFFFCLLFSILGIRTRGSHIVCELHKYPSSVLHPYSSLYFHICCEVPGCPGWT